MSLQPRYVPLTGMEPGILCPCSIRWAKPARAQCLKERVSAVGKRCSMLPLRVLCLVSMRQLGFKLYSFLFVNGLAHTLEMCLVYGTLLNGFSYSDNVARHITQQEVYTERRASSQLTAAWQLGPRAGCTRLPSCPIYPSCFAQVIEVICSSSSCC